jgi:branched-chain amino acid transport system permease protein
MAPPSRRRWLPIVAATLAVGIAVALPSSGLFGRYGVYLLNLVAISAIATTGLTLFVGYVGQLSIGQAAFYGLGAYAAGDMTKAGYPFLLALVVATGLAGGLGWLIGLVALRLRGFYLAVVTLALGLIAFQLFKNLDPLTGGVSGLGRIPPPSVGGLVLGTSALYYYFNLAVLILVLALSVQLVKSPTGRAMRAIAANELAAQSVGVNSHTIKTAIFAIAAGVAGLAGGLYVHLLRFITPDDFGLVLSIQFLTMAIVGGLGSVFGGLIGAATVTLVIEQFSAWPEIQPLLYGAALVLLVRFMPTGIAGAASWIIERLWPVPGRKPN